ncbi:16S rRNA (guanine(966)-N(2))-methyltransferase RsmD [Calycomorphotria hydatis]|uniref:Ribosomal RNA small subunit methyltransferase D n=1 Tax=Calycomorphotria hydatis TaxID=2528027 RepID=A0A517T3Q4_9PLAN|nr:16S rRNA (guanine(966)-N(2))-methyltransferase RsmD [Calycomorphotria hydatis]QDT63008.1 Ribosomal RNA small subunit methyltransferase D [Calycomorphotria hydatis]
MRIITGRFRGRSLVASPGQTTRPITDRAKERLFARLEPLLPDAKIADIFSGTGSMGLEALSRGAASVVFIERDQKAYELLQQNVSQLKVEDECLCWRTDAMRCSYRPKTEHPLHPYDLVFFDPPFPKSKELNPGRPLWKSLSRLARPDVTNEDARLILRTPIHYDLQLPDDWTLDWEVESGVMRISCWMKAVVDTELDEQ